MNGWFNPDSWMDVLDHLLLVLGAISVAAIPSWFAARNHKEIKDVKNQVVNGHKEPLRFDLDRVLQRLDDLTSFVTEVGRGVTGLRSDLADEESRRREGVRELRSDIDRHRSEFHEGMNHIERRLSELEREIKPNE